MQTQRSNTLHNAIMEAGSKDRPLMLAPGIDNDIYSIVDACPNTCEMWKAIKRLKQGQWPEELRNEFPLITQVPNITLTPDKDDEFMWKWNDGVLRKFSLFMGASILKKRSKNEVPDMFAGPLCQNDMDSHNNLFFNCDFSKRMWKMVKRKSELKINGSDQGSIIQELASMQNGNSIGSVEECGGIVTNLVDTVTQRLCSLKVKRTKAVDKVETGWNIKLKSPIWPWEEIGYYVWYCERSNPGRRTISDAIPSLPLDPFSEGLLLNVLYGVNGKCSWFRYSPTLSVNGSYMLFDDAISISILYYCGCGLNDLGFD
nr:hypothetical protein [Tanacetum cinerariifolium]GEV33467.1 hypothetical protein [Tanacetum cinerariifolium]